MKWRIYKAISFRPPVWVAEHSLAGSQKEWFFTWERALAHVCRQLKGIPPGCSEEEFFDYYA